MNLSSGSIRECNTLCDEHHKRGFERVQEAPTSEEESSLIDLLCALVRQRDHNVG